MEFGIDWNKELGQKAPQVPSAPGLKVQSGDFGINWGEEVKSYTPQQIEQPKKEGIIGKVKNWFTGDDRREFDYPELPTTVVDANQKMIPIQQRLAYDAGNIERQSNTLGKYLGVSPDAISFDQHGNQMVNYQGKDYYVNKPGLSEADVTKTMHDVGLYGLPGAGVGKLAKGASLASKALLSGGAAAGTSVAEDLMSDPNAPVDKAKALITGTLGIAGEFATPVVNKLLGTIFRSKKLYDNGKITDRGKEVLKENGIDPNKITDDFAKVFSDRAERAKGPVLSEGVETPVPVSKGQFTGDLHQQGKEQAMLHGAYGEEPQRIMVGLEKQTNEALRKNADAIRSKYGSGIEYQGEGAGQIYRDVIQKRKEVRAPISQLYSDAKKNQAWIPNQHISDFVDSLESKLINETVPVEGAVKSRLDTLRQILKDGKDPSVNQLQAWRKMTSRAQKGAYRTDPQAAYGLGVMKKEFDDMLQSDITADLIVGDSQAPALYRQAIKSWSDKANLIGEAFEKKILRNPNLTDKEALNFILGSSKVSTNQQSARMVGEIKRIFGDNSPQMKMLKDEMFIKIMHNQPADSFSAQKYVSSLRRIEMDNRRVFNEVFTPEERKALYGLKDVAKKTVYDEKAINPSKSAHAIARNVADVFGLGGKIANVVLARFADKYSQAAAKQAAIDAATLPHITQKFIPDGFVGPSLAGILYDEDY